MFCWADTYGHLNCFLVFKLQPTEVLYAYYCVLEPSGEDIIFTDLLDSFWCLMDNYTVIFWTRLVLLDTYDCLYNT